ncbi:hypothetical protein L083_1929 [Actinoplanes sp. N902-109]|nr:hypothetical protein L083_1929 [Actinoplanes sp. N902-109]
MREETAQLGIVVEQRRDGLQPVDRARRVAQQTGMGAIDAVTRAGDDAGRDQPGAGVAHLGLRAFEHVRQLGQRPALGAPPHELGERGQPRGHGKLGEDLGGAGGFGGHPARLGRAPRRGTRFTGARRRPR